MSQQNFVSDIINTRNRGLDIMKVDINLATAETDREFAIAGNSFYVWDAPDETSYIEVKLNATNKAAIPFVRQTGAKKAFDKLYITTPAGQSGTLTLLIGTEDPVVFEMIDNRSATVASLADIKAELTGDTSEETWGTQKTIGVTQSEVLASNASRKGCIIQSKAANTGLIYIGFDDTVTATKAIAELAAGMSFSVDDYRGALHAISDTAGQLLLYGEW